jgi:hypothetical protein
MKCITWLLDKGVEKLFAVSLGSLREKGRYFWGNNIKLVLDLGLSEPMYEFLMKLEDEGVFVHRLPLPDNITVVGGDNLNGIGVMRRRIELPNILPQILETLAINVDEFIVCDSDTIFLQSPEGFPFPSANSQISIMKEWDLVGCKEMPMLLYRPSSFRGGKLPDDKSLDLICSRLDLNEEELRQLPTYNTGVIGFLSKASFTLAWQEEYDLIKSIFDEDGHPIFSPYAAEQNAFSISLYKKRIKALDLPRIFNQFPPRPPSNWPENTIIAHFITFSRNHTESRYHLWYEMHQLVKDSKYIPEHLLTL